MLKFSISLFLFKLKFIKFSDEIEHNNNLLNIFFDKKNYEIKGWTTTDIYQNRVETKLFNIEINMMIDENLFRVQKYIN